MLADVFGMLSVTKEVQDADVKKMLLALDSDHDGKISR